MALQPGRHLLVEHDLGVLVAAPAQDEAEELDQDHRSSEIHSVGRPILLSLFGGSGLKAPVGFAGAALVEPVLSGPDMLTNVYPNRSQLVLGVLVGMLSIAAGLIWLERRLLGFWQDRYGPNRVGPFGLAQVVADMIKIFSKEDWIPPFADKPVFILAPAVIIVTVLMSFAVISTSV